MRLAGSRLALVDDWLRFSRRRRRRLALETISAGIEVSCPLPQRIGRLRPDLGAGARQPVSSACCRCGTHRDCRSQPAREAVCSACVARFSPDESVEQSRETASVGSRPGIEVAVDDRNKSLSHDGDGLLSGRRQRQQGSATLRGIGAALQEPCLLKLRCAAADDRPVKADLRSKRGDANRSDPGHSAEHGIGRGGDGIVDSVHKLVVDGRSKSAQQQDPEGGRDRFSGGGHLCSLLCDAHSNVLASAVPKAHQDEAR